MCNVNSAIQAAGATQHGTAASNASATRSEGTSAPSASFASVLSSQISAQSRNTAPDATRMLGSSRATDRF